MKCLIIDDDPMARAVLEKYISATEGLELTGTFEDPLDALHFLKKEKVNLIFLDIEMPQMSGLEFVQGISDFKVKIIMTTSHDKFAIEAFRYNVSGFLVKPVKYSDFAGAVKKAFSQEMQNSSLDDNETLFIKIDKTIVKLFIKDIKLIECIGDYVTLYTAEKRYTIRSTMKNIETRFKGKEYMRIHRSYIVRIDAINDIEDDSISCLDKIIPIGKTYRSEVFLRLNHL